MNNKCTARHASHDDKSHCVLPGGHDKAHRDSSGRLFAYHSAPNRYSHERRADRIKTLEAETTSLRKELKELKSNLWWAVLQVKEYTPIEEQEVREISDRIYAELLPTEGDS
jgi:hypothetical protein